MKEGVNKVLREQLELIEPPKEDAVKPNIIIEKLKSNTLKTANDRIDSISNLKNTNEYKELEQLYNVGIEPIKQGDISGSIKGKLTIYNHIKELLENAKKEVIICTSTIEINHKSRFFSLIFERLRKANIKIKIALSGETKDIKKINSKFKINAKIIEIDTKFFISDSQEVLFMISNDNMPDEEIAIWLNTPFFASSLSFMFDQATRV